MEEFYQDWLGREIAVGVKIDSGDGGPDGTVVRIDELDVDYDDNLQQAVGYGPYIWVQWPGVDGPERFSGFLVSSVYEENPTYQFDDVEVAA